MPRRSIYANHANTLRSADETITLPVEIHVYADGSAVACYEGHGDASYPDIDALCEAHRIDADDVRALPDVWAPNA